MCCGSVFRRNPAVALDRLFLPVGCGGQIRVVVVPAGVAVAAAVAMAVPVVEDDSAVFVIVVPCTAAFPCCLKFGKSRGRAYHRKQQENLANLCT